MSICRLLFIIILSFIFSSCMYEHVTHLSDEELEWVGKYKAGDTIFFLSKDERNIDTMTIDESYIKNKAGHFYSLFCFECGSNYEASASYFFKLKHELNTYDGSFYMRKHVGDSLMAVMSVWKLCSNNINISKRDNIVVNGTNSYYPPVWADKVHNKVTEYKWDKKRGLVYYRFEDGEEFYRKD